MFGKSNTSMQNFTVRTAHPTEYDQIGKLLVDVYSQLDGFPKPHEQPAYYNLLANVGDLTQKPGIYLLAAVSHSGEIAGAVVYFSDMKNYGSGGTATSLVNTSGFRLLAVHPDFRGQGIGKILTGACIAHAKAHQHHQLVIHTTAAMKTAWKMYESLGFKRITDLDFMQGDLAVYGFILTLNS
jgi:ribosomal protein S18 acetylase RimI-like enzyme